MKDYNQYHTDLLAKRIIDTIERYCADNRVLIDRENQIVNAALDLCHRECVTGIPVSLNIRVSGAEEE